MTAGVELIKCDGEDSAFKLLEDPGGSSGVMDTGGDGGGNSGSDDAGVLSCSLKPTLVHIPASVLHHPGWVKVLNAFLHYFYFLFFSLYAI